MTIKIFLFHRVAPQRDPMWDPMDPALFDRVVKYLSKQYCCIKLEDYFRDKKSFQNPEKKLCALVFDDGYKDFIEYALPVLKKYKVPSSMYIVTGCVQSQLPPWTYQLDHCLYHSERLELAMDASLLPVHLQTTKWANAQQRIEFGRALKPLLKKMDNQNRLSVFNQVIDGLDDAKVSENLMMDWREIREIIDEGVEVGSHTHTHPLLSSMQDEGLIKQELEQSFALIKEHCNIIPYTISYPIGSYDARVMRRAEEAGYKLGLAVDQQFYNDKQHDSFAVPRVELYNEGYLKTKLRMAGVYEKIKRILK